MIHQTIVHMGIPDELNAPRMDVLYDKFTHYVTTQPFNVYLVNRFGFLNSLVV